jgi:hypothetical protein
LKRIPLEQDIKHRSIRQRYVEGRRWEDTDIFRDLYPRRFAVGGVLVRGTATIEELAQQYYGRVDAMFADLKANGFQMTIEGRSVPLPNLHIGHDGEPLMGNNGNHRVAMCKIIGLKKIHARVQSIHANAPKDRIPKEIAE